MEIFSEYEHAEYRYVLGNIQDKKAKTIIYLGLNPSYATSHKHDKTTSFITRWATTQKYENVIFLNICPIHPAGILGYLLAGSRVLCRWLQGW